MKLAKRLDLIKPSATLAIAAKAAKLQQQGVPVVNLALGEPDFATPQHICDAAKAAIDEGFTHYTAVPGIPELRKAIVNYYERLFGVRCAPETAIITNGGKHSLYGLLQTVLNPGDEVLIPAPYWVSHPELVMLAEATPISVPTSAATAYKVSPEQLEKYVTPKTRMLLLNSPSNPTGACYSQDELDAVVEWAIAKNLYVFCDEIYAQMVYDPIKPTSAVKWFERYPEQVGISNGLSKAFAMTGWRLGFTLAHPDIIKGISTLQSQMTSNICSIAQKAAVVALNGSFDSVETMCQAFKKRRDMALAEIATWPGVVCPKPDGAFYLFLDISSLLNEDCPDDFAFCNMLLEKAHVAVVPGSAFGAPGGFRISYALSEDELMRALKAIRAVL